jgi:hypothetical protein
MADEKQNQYALLALVGIVAVVGIVGLTFMVVGGRSSDAGTITYAADGEIAAAANAAGMAAAARCINACYSSDPRYNTGAAQAALDDCYLKCAPIERVSTSHLQIS